jgi:hypothetical protein
MTIDEIELPYYFSYSPQERLSWELTPLTDFRVRDFNYQVRRWPELGRTMIPRLVGQSHAITIRLNVPYLSFEASRPDLSLRQRPLMLSPPRC